MDWFDMELGSGFWVGMPCDPPKPGVQVFKGGFAAVNAVGPCFPSWLAYRSPAHTCVMRGTGMGSGFTWTTAFPSAYVRPPYVVDSPATRRYDAIAAAWSSGLRIDQIVRDLRISERLVCSDLWRLRRRQSRLPFRKSHVVTDLIRIFARRSERAAAPLHRLDRVRQHAQDGMPLGLVEIVEGKRWQKLKMDAKRWSVMVDVDLWPNFTVNDPIAYAVHWWSSDVLPIDNLQAWHWALRQLQKALQRPEWRKKIFPNPRHSLEDHCMVFGSCSRVQVGKYVRRLVTAERLWRKGAPIEEIMQETGWVRRVLRMRILRTRKMTNGIYFPVAPEGVEKAMLKPQRIRRPKSKRVLSGDQMIKRQVAQMRVAWRNGWSIEEIARYLALEVPVVAQLVEELRKERGFFPLKKARVSGEKQLDVSDGPVAPDVLIRVSEMRPSWRNGWTTKDIAFHLGIGENDAELAIEFLRNRYGYFR